MNILEGHQPQGPIGYAEYTGSGIANDTHNSKIVLDYRRGRIFITVTHYQNWHIAAGGNLAEPNALPQYVVEGQAANQGTNSAWFCIDMNQ